MISDTIFLSAFFLAIGIFLFFFDEYFVPAYSVEFRRRLTCLCLIFGLFFFLVGFWLHAIYQYQHKPHLIVSSLGDQIISQHYTTNPIYVHYLHSWQAGSNGLQLVNIPVTNYYWSVWPWLK